MLNFIQELITFTLTLTWLIVITIFIKLLYPFVFVVVLVVALMNTIIYHFLCFVNCFDFVIFLLPIFLQLVFVIFILEIYLIVLNISYNLCFFFSIYGIICLKKITFPFFFNYNLSISLINIH